jgi:hypothetical protein
MNHHCEDCNGVLTTAEVAYVKASNSPVVRCICTECFRKSQGITSTNPCAELGRGFHPYTSLPKDDLNIIEGCETGRIYPGEGLTEGKLNIVGGPVTYKCRYCGDVVPEKSFSALIRPMSSSLHNSHRQRDCIRPRTCKGCEDGLRDLLAVSDEIQKGKKS